MSGIFISYRRDDAAYAAGRLYDRLADHFGDEQIFRDIDTLTAGSDFAQRIDQAVGLSAAFVAVIGRDWATLQDSKGRRRIDVPGDWVHMELAFALRRGILVVPVLVENAKMPTEAELPVSLRKFAGRQALELTDVRWDYDAQALIEVLEGVVPAPARSAPVLGAGPAPVGAEGAAPLSRVDAAGEGTRRGVAQRRTRALAVFCAVALVSAVIAVRASSGPDPSPASVTTEQAEGSTSVPADPATPTGSRLQYPSGAADVTEFPLPTVDSGPRGIAVGPDGALWFTESRANKIGRITATGAVTEFPVPTANAGLDSIVVGPDEALWFTERAGNKIGRITTAGVVTEFRTPTTASNPVGVPGQGAGASSIAVGPDRALWFTEANADNIGRITTAGLITEFPLPNRERTHAYPSAITAGPDGAMWFTQALAGKIGRIDVTSFAISEFPLPGGGGAVGLASIVLGPDRALWFTDTRKIGRIRTTGEVTSFPAPFLETPGGESMTVGPDGTIWFTESRVNRIGRITSTGSVMEIQLSTVGAGLAHLAVDKSGAVWFTEENTNKIGVIHPKN